ncbi:MAG TPA: rhamnulose-1-phosphate aldolase [Anaerolineaceae bacterium]
MTIEAPFPELDELLHLMGEAGTRMSEIEASEGAAGNISVCIGWTIDPRRKFSQEETIPFPEAVPALAGKTIIVTGSGRRLREIINDPVANLGVVRVNEDGASGQLFTSPSRLFARVTSEFNSHLAIHEDQVKHSQTNFNAVLHAQPRHLTFLSHIPRYQDEIYLNRHLLRWQPELIVNLPEGVGFIPFEIPGSPALMRATLEKLRMHRVVVWAKHGVMSRSNTSVKRAADIIEYAEAGASYEFMNLESGEIAEGLSPEEIRSIAKTFNISQNIF